MPEYTGTSIVDYLKSKGQESSFASRSTLAKEKGISNYTGTSDQNVQLLNTLRGSSQQVAPAVNTGTDVAATSDSIVNAQREEENKKIRDAIETQQRIATETQEAELAKLKSEVLPASGVPTAPSLTAKYEELRTSQGVVPIEEEITSIRTEKADLLAQLSKFKKAEPVGVVQGFATGRISEEQQNVQDRIDFLTRQESASVDRLNNKNKYIETVMDLTETDYDNAVQQYNTTFSQNIQMQNTLQNYKTVEQAEENRIRDDARAYLTSVNNMIQNSGKSWDDVDMAMKADITATELKAGYAPGTLEAFARSKPKANLLGSRDGYDASGNAITTLLYDDGLGGIKTTIVKTGGTKKTDIETSEGETGSLRTVSDIKERIASNPDITRADIQAEMDKDKTLTQASITSILDEARLYNTLPEDMYDDFIDSLKEDIKSRDTIFTKMSKVTESVVEETKKSRVVQDSDGKYYRLNQSQLDQLSEKLK